MNDIYYDEHDTYTYSERVCGSCGVGGCDCDHDDIFDDYDSDSGE